MGEEPKVEVESSFKVSGKLQIYELPANFTYEDFKKLSAEERKQYLVHDGPNLVVNGGADQIVNLMIGANTFAFNMNAMGSSNTAVAPTQTSLVAIIGSPLAVTDATLESVGKAHYNTFWSSGDGVGTWRESSIQTTAGIMLARRTFPDFVKGAVPAVTAWTITLTPVS